MPGISRHVWLELASPSLVFRLIHLHVDDGQGFLGSASQPGPKTLHMESQANPILASHRSG